MRPRIPILALAALLACALAPFAPGDASGSGREGGRRRHAIGPAPAIPAVAAPGAVREGERYETALPELPAGVDECELFLLPDDGSGRMIQLTPERELEDRMLSFIRGDADVLVSTTIIESGLDIPQANTLVVERADALGLAQLYQIRGRVGRSDVVAHAYLFYPEARELTSEARARLATLADHTELGAGFRIAMRDLELRGAGDLLGAEQSGHVAAVGFELYVELLGEAVAELTGARRGIARPVRVDAQVDAYVPATYIAAEAAKIDLHRRVALSETEDELRELAVGIEDRFGPLPEPVERLFRIQEAKLKLARLGADFLVLRAGRASLGPLVLGSGELEALRALAPTAVYSSARREVGLRAADLPAALGLVDAVLTLRVAA